MIILDIIVVTFILVFGLKYQNRFKNLDRYDQKLLKKLFFYHLFFSLVFFVYISNYGGDATNYWFVTYFDNYEWRDILDVIAKGSVTGYLLMLNYIPAKVLGLNFLTGNLIYGLMGYITFVNVYVVLKKRVVSFELLKKSKVAGVSLFPLVFFLPNLHFWSSGVGKDTLLFFCVGLFVLGVNNIKKNIFPLAIALLVSILIRPHITLFLIIAFGGGFILDGKLKLFQKIFLTLIFAAGFIFVLQSAQKFVDIENFETETITLYADKKVTLLSADRIGSAVDVSNYSFPLKVFTFLFRPLFTDGTSPLFLVASFENFLLLLIFLRILPKSLNGFKEGDFAIKGLVLFFILGTIAFSLVLGNLGIMMRQKTPFILALIIFALWCFQTSALKKNKLQQ